MNVIAQRYVTPTPIDVTTLIINYIPLLYTDKLNFAVGLQKIYIYRDFNIGKYIFKCSLLNANIWLSPQAHLALLLGVLSYVPSRDCKPGANLMMSCHVGICSAILIYVLLHKLIEYHSHDSCRKFSEQFVYEYGLPVY